MGEYQLRPSAVVRVAFEEGTLVLTMPNGKKSLMVHESGATYALGSVGSDTTVTLLADAAGQVVGLLARDEGSPDRRLRKIR